MGIKNDGKEVKPSESIEMTEMDIEPLYTPEKRKYEAENSHEDIQGEKVIHRNFVDGFNE